MRHVIITTSRDGTSLTLQVIDNAVDNGYPREVRIVNIDKLSILDRRIGETIITTGKQDHPGG